MALAGLVCMLHLGRSGSTVLGDMLGQNPYVEWDGEIYEPGRKLFREGSDPIAMMQDRAAQRAELGFYGFELKPFHCRLVAREVPQMIADLRASGVAHWIVLKRRNYLRKIASTAMARVTGTWHRRDERSRGQTPPVSVRIDPQAHFIDAETRPLAEFFAGYDSFFDNVGVWLQDANALHLTYEDDVQAEPLTGYRRICRFLDVAPMPVTVRYAPTTPFPLATVIENLDEVARALEGTPWAAMARHDA